MPTRHTRLNSSISFKKRPLRHDAINGIRQSGHKDHDQTGELQPRRLLFDGLNFTAEPEDDQPDDNNNTFDNV